MCHKWNLIEDKVFDALIKSKIYASDWKKI